jgi:RNA polymerase sigma factor (sigma-70 family)
MSVSDEQIVEGLSMVRRMAVRYRGTPLGADDAYGVGSLALVEAAQRFDPENGAPFLGYAFLRVRGAMADACRRGRGEGARVDREVVCDPDELCEVSDRRVLRPEARLDVLAAVSRLRRRLRTVLLRHACGVPSREIAADLGVSESRVSQLLALARRRVRVEAGLQPE